MLLRKLKIRKFSRLEAIPIMNFQEAFQTEWHFWKSIPILKTDTRMNLFGANLARFVSHYSLRILKAPKLLIDFLPLLKSNRFCELPEWHAACYFPIDPNNGF
jgi:hypothetical protein